MTHAISLQTLLAPFVTTSTVLSTHIPILGVSLDSRQIGEGDLFVAVQGTQLDGRVFIEKAVRIGASAVLSETKNSDQHGRVSFLFNTPIIEFL